MDKAKLEEGLKQLTGYDFEEVEKVCRLKGDAAPEIMFSKDFQSRLAAKALGVGLDEIKKLPLPEFVSMTQGVSNFLLSNLAEGSDQS